MRTLKTAWLGGSVGSSYLGGRFMDRFRDDEQRGESELERHVVNAKKIVSTMSELRGPMMKIGQLLSTHAEALPGQYGEILRSLQASAPPMSYKTISDVIEMELGGKPEELFKHFSREAVAAASLGQVHKATLPDGTLVAVKVQYPGADASVDGDVKNMKFGAALVKNLLADVIGNQRLDLTPIAEEIAEHLAQETDYCREAYNAKLLAKLFKGDDQIVIPHVHDKFSGLRVITYDWMEGGDLGTALKGDAETRYRIVHQLNRAFWFQMHRGGVLHADPHPGNYRVLADGRLALLDFGCVKIFDDAFLREFFEMVRARLEDDPERLKRCMSALGLMDDPDDPAELQDMTMVSNYFSLGLLKDEDFDFGEYSYVHGAKELVTYFLKRRRMPPAQKNFLFMTRVVLGYYEYFSRARSKHNFRRMVEPFARDPWPGRVLKIPPYGE
ncbi:MAG: AarF/UbiB family protein [Deltaproteobacteria bacterium]